MSDALAVVAQMVAGWERLDADAIAACFAEDGVWHNMPYAPIEGREAIRGAVARFVVGMASATFHIRHQGEIAPGIVLNERNDVFRTHDGKVIDFAAVGVFETADGLITEWRDYFDSALLGG